MARKPSKQMLRVLTLLAENAHKSYFGYEISKVTHIAPGTLYPMLYNMEKKGWVIGEWEGAEPTEEGQGRRRYYNIEALGKRIVRNELIKSRQYTLSLRKVQ